MSVKVAEMFADVSAKVDGMSEEERAEAFCVAFPVLIMWLVSVARIGRAVLAERARLARICGSPIRGVGVEDAQWTDGYNTALSDCADEIWGGQ